MEESAQAQTFLLMMTTGFLLGALMDAYRSLLNHWQLRTLAFCLGDSMYWLVSSILVFCVLLLGNWGDVRFYVFVGLSGGAAFYRFWFKHRLHRLLLSLRNKNNKQRWRLFWRRK